MEFENSFVVGLPPQETFDLLLDVPRIAKCMPGATLESFDGDELAGRVRVKIGPVAMTYAGQARIIVKDRVNLRTTIEAHGRERRGTSEASAKVTATLRAVDEGTQVLVLTDVAVTGKPAQLGRGLLSDVSRMLVGQFSAALAYDINSGSAEAGDDAAPARSSVAPRGPIVPNPQVGETHSARVQEPNEIDALALIGRALPKQKLIVGGLLCVLLVRLLGCRRGRTEPS